MTDFESAREKGNDESSRIELDKRDVRALTEAMTVLPQGGEIHTVVSESGRSYTVDLREGRCTCPDAEYRLDPSDSCKHERRAAYAVGDRPIPAWVDSDAVDPLLGEQTDATPRVVAADGGIIEAGDDGEILDERDDRPDECNCGDWNEGVDLPCWPCYRDGFEEPLKTDE